MTSCFRFAHGWTLSVLFVLLPLLASSARAASPAPLDALGWADDARVAAIVSGERTQLDAILSEDLVYTHSNGLINDKKSYMDLLLSGHLKYESVDYETRKFTLASPDIAVMTGRCHIKALNKGVQELHYLTFLAVWRKENGNWVFLAWQSCGLPEPAVPTK